MDGRSWRLQPAAAVILQAECPVGTQWSGCASATPKRHHHLASSREARPAWSPTGAQHAAARRTAPCLEAAPRSSVPPGTRDSMRARRENGKKWSAGELSARHRPGARRTCRSDESYQACAARRCDGARRSGSTTSSSAMACLVSRRSADRSSPVERFWGKEGRRCNLLWRRRGEGAPLLKERKDASPFASSEFK